jgi:hypothetical protein
VFRVEALVHRPTGYSFEFGVDKNGSLWAFFQPGPDGSRKGEHAGNWDWVSSYARQWIERVREEHNAPDLWAAVADQRELITETGVENTPFTSAEQGRIAEQLTEVMEYLRATSDLEAGRLERIETELRYLKDASRRLPRLDWRNVLLGSFLSLAIDAVIPPGLMQHVLTMISRGLRGMFGGGDLELPGGPPELG